MQETAEMEAALEVELEAELELEVLGELEAQEAVVQAHQEVHERLEAH